MYQNKLPHNFRRWGTSIGEVRLRETHYLNISLYLVTHNDGGPDISQSPKPNSFFMYFWPKNIYFDRLSSQNYSKTLTTKYIL